MKRWILLILVSLGLFAVVAARKQAHTKPVIGILQTASHPALDLARDGFIEGLGDEFKLRVQNAEGLISQAQLIANNFHRDPNVKAVYTIATPATQVMTRQEREKPIVFSAVTDPAVLGISDGQDNVTGCRDMINVKKQVALLQELCPKAKTVALLFNPAEVNSVAMSRIMREELESCALSVVDVGIRAEAEVAMATREACRRADVIMTPTDNLVAATISQIARITNDKRVSLIVSDNLLVGQGALAACGVDYYDAGKQAASLVREILLSGKRPADLPVLFPRSEHVLINEKIAESLCISTKTNFYSSER